MATKKLIKSALSACCLVALSGCISTPKFIFVEKLTGEKQALGISIKKSPYDQKITLNTGIFLADFIESLHKAGINVNVSEGVNFKGKKYNGPDLTNTDVMLAIEVVSGQMKLDYAIGPLTSLELKNAVYYPIEVSDDLNDQDIDRIIAAAEKLTVVKVQSVEVKIGSFLYDKSAQRFLIMAPSTVRQAVFEMVATSAYPLASSKADTAESNESPLNGVSLKQEDQYASRGDNGNSETSIQLVDLDKRIAPPIPVIERNGITRTQAPKPIISESISPLVDALTHGTEELSDIDFENTKRSASNKATLLEPKGAVVTDAKQPGINFRSALTVDKNKDNQEPLIIYTYEAPPMDKRKVIKTEVVDKKVVENAVREYKKMHFSDLY